MAHVGHIGHHRLAELCMKSTNQQLGKGGCGPVRLSRRKVGITPMASPPAAHAIGQRAHQADIAAAIHQANAFGGRGCQGDSGLFIGGQHATVEPQNTQMRFMMVIRVD